MFGRPDGTRVREASALRRFMPYVSPRRGDALVYFSDDVKVEAALRHLERLNAERPPEARITLFHLVLDALAGALHTRPQINRFIAGRRLWQRDGVWISFSAKQAFAEDARVLTIKRRFAPDEGVAAVADAVHERLRARRGGEADTSEKEMGLLLRLPGPIIGLVMWLARTADRFGLLPKSMILSDPLFTSAFVANLGSLGYDGAYHHLWEWGTCPIFCVLGRIRDEEDGRRVSINYTYDERIADGFYAATALRRVRAALESPGG